MGDLLTHQAAAGLVCADLTASSRYGVGSWRSLGIEVIVKPPASGILGMWTSNHWPGRNYTAEVGSKHRDRFNASTLLPWVSRQ